MNNAMLKQAVNDHLIFAEKTLTMITSGEIGLTKSIKPIETAIGNILDAQGFLNKISNQSTHDHKLRLESIVMKIDDLTRAAIVLDEKGDSELQLDILDKVREVISKELKPAIFS